MSRLCWYPGHELLVPDIVRAEGCRLVDGRGRSYLDLEAGVWAASVGHGHPRLRAAAAGQWERVGHGGFNWSADVVEEAAAEILDLLGLEAGRCVFLCSGSEAVEYGVRVARAVAGRPLLLTMADSYFGAYGDASRRDRDGWADLDWFGCDGCPLDAAGAANVAGADGPPCDGTCERWAALPLDRIGGFLLEPGSSSGLVRFPPARLVRSLAVAVREAGGLVLVNEVTTGVGRTGAWFGFQHYGIEPDIVALGKGIGGGYPVSAAALSARVVARLGAEPIRYAQSHQNDPLGAAVAREVIRIVREEGLVERSHRLGAFLEEGLGAVARRTGRIARVRGRGLMLAVELAGDPDGRLTVEVHRELVGRGFLTGRRPGTAVLRLDPPLVVGREDLAAFLAALEEVLSGLDEGTGGVGAAPEREGP